MDRPVEQEIDRPDKQLVYRSAGLREADDPLSSTVRSFDELGLHPDILKGLTKIRFTKPSKIQGRAIPALLAKPPKNFIGQAQSGTGKTAAFVLAMLSRVDPEKQYPQAIALSPTRELCRQTYDVFMQMSQYTKIRPTLIVPSFGDEKTGTVINPTTIETQIIVATPGKLESYIKRRSIDLSKIIMFVIDEADELLLVRETTGQDNLTLRIHKAVIDKSPNCQMCLFSATFNDKVMTFADKTVPHPRDSIFIEADKLSLNKLYQYYINCRSEEMKFTVLDMIYRNFSVGKALFLLLCVIPPRISPRE